MPLCPEQQRLVSSNVGIAYAVMRRLSIHGRGFAEAKSEAMVALCEAAASYTASRGAFSTWAWVKVSWHLKTWMTRQNRIRARAMGIPIEGAAEETDEGPSPDDQCHAGQVENLIAEFLADGSPLTRKVGVLALRGMTKEEIAEELGVSVSTVARRRKEARELISPLMEILRADDEALWHIP